MTVTVKAMIVSVLLALIDKDNRNKPSPLGKIFASKLDRSGSRNEQREFQ